MLSLRSYSSMIASDQGKETKSNDKNNSEYQDDPVSEYEYSQSNHNNVNIHISNTNQVYI